MNLLLDTHVAIWALMDLPRLSRLAREILSDPENTIFISSVSVCEVAIKHSNHPLHMPLSGDEMTQMVEQASMEFLDFTAAHAVKLGSLPLHHGDPFDRMLIAQAMVEPLRFLTHDAALTQYSDLVIWV